MEPWISENNPRKQTGAAVLSSVVGLLLVVGFRNFGTSGDNALAGFLLGVLLLVIGVLGLVVSGKQTVVIDPKMRSILVEDSNRFWKKKRSIMFSDVRDVMIGYLGKRQNFVNCYFLVLKLRSGEEYSLFAPGRYYEGGSDRSTVEGWRRRLAEYLGR